MNKKISDYTREELKGIIYSDSKKLKKMYPSYRWGQAVFNYIDQYIGVARKVQFEDHVDCFYNDDAVDAFVEKALDRIYDSEYGKNFIILREKP